MTRGMGESIDVLILEQEICGAARVEGSKG